MLALAGLASAQELADDLGAYLDALVRWRGGEAPARVELLTLGQRLCDVHDRCDARDVATYYADLSPEARARGLADEAALDAVRERLAAAGQDGLEGGESWAELRARSMEALAPLCLPGPDVVPAARARALLARLELSIVEEDPDLDPASRAGWIARAEGSVAGSVALYERCGMVTPRLEPLWVRGRLARARGDRRAAHADQQACLALAERVGNLEFQERALLALVQLARDVGDHHAVDRHLAALAQRVDPSSSWPLTREHASSLLSADQPEASLAFLVAHPPEADAYLDAWHALLAAAYLRTGDVDAARREVAGLDADDEVSALAQAAVALASGQHDDALAGLDRDLSGWSARGRAEALVLRGEAYLAAGDPLQAELALEAALATARSWSGATDGKGSIMGEWLGLHAVALAARVRAEAGDPVGAAVLIEDAQARALRAPGEQVDAAELVEWAGRFERGLVTWSVGADATTCAWIRGDGTGGAATSPRGREAWRTAVRRLREAAIAGDAQRAQDLGQQVVAELLPAELREELAGATADERALLCLHGPLEGLPLALLDLPFTPVVLPGLPGPTAADPLTVDTRWRLLGAPAEGEGPALPGAARELARLAERYPSAALASGAAFTRGALLEALRSGEALHVATHLAHEGSCDDGRLAPVGLALSGGDVLCAREVLEAGARTPLVVLAACETAGGRAIDAEGTHGLARAFLEAGTRDLVVTLWPVDDEAARAFALAFHGALEQAPSPARAVELARRALAAEGRPPADWAAFRALGRD